MSTRLNRRTRFSALAVCAVALTGVIASAEMPDVVFRVEAEHPVHGSVGLDIMQAWGTWEGDTWTFNLLDIFPDGFDFVIDGFGSIGTLPSLDVVIQEDPQVNLNFAVVAGPVDTLFHIGSSVLSFDPIANAEGQASAAYSLQDINGDGATLTGIGDTGGGYLAQYNGWAGNPSGPDGVTFAETHFLMQADPFLNADLEENVPATGYLAIGDTVTSISSLASFTLTAQDFASGTTNFTVIPEPASVALLALGGLAAFRRR